MRLRVPWEAGSPTCGGSVLSIPSRATRAPFIYEEPANPPEDLALLCLGRGHEDPIDQSIRPRREGDVTDQDGLAARHRRHSFLEQEIME